MSVLLRRLLRHLKRERPDSPRNLRWLKPVTPGDTITYRSTVTGKRELNSRPEWGLVFSLNEGFNQNGELVFSFEGKVLTPKRPA